MFEVAIDKSLRSFKIPENSQPVKAPNQLFHYGFINDRLCLIDQKGTKTEFENYTNGQLYSINEQSKNPILVVRSRNNIHLINQKGLEIGKLRMPFNEIEDVAVFNLNSGKTVVSIIDGLENNVYLYDIAGTELTENSLEGKTRVHVSAYGEGFIVTTVVDSYIIQYFEN
jgi:stage III sporulation protein SpoIIIAA